MVQRPIQDEHKNNQLSIWTQFQTMEYLKFTYIISCKLYGTHRRSANDQVKNILGLMLKYPSPHIAYVDEEKYREKDKSPKVLLLSPC